MTNPETKHPSSFFPDPPNDNPAVIDDNQEPFADRLFKFTNRSKVRLFLDVLDAPLNPKATFQNVKNLLSPASPEESLDQDQSTLTLNEKPASVDEEALLKEALIYFNGIDTHEGTRFANLLIQKLKIQLESSSNRELMIAKILILHKMRSYFSSLAVLEGSKNFDLEEAAKILATVIYKYKQAQELPEPTKKIYQSAVREILAEIDKIIASDAYQEIAKVKQKLIQEKPNLEEVLNLTARYIALRLITKIFEDQNRPTLASIVSEIKTNLTQEEDDIKNALGFYYQKFFTTGIRAISIK